jgi:hypothetical protein
LLGVGQKLSPLESIRISAGFRSFDDKLTIVSFWSLLISLCLENLLYIYKKNYYSFHTVVSKCKKCKNLFT